MPSEVVAVGHRSRGERRGVGQHLTTVTTGEHRTGPEGAQFERSQIEIGSRPRVGRIQQLESAIEQHAVHPIGADPPTGFVIVLQHEHVQPGAVQIQRTDQTGEPGTDDHDIPMLTHRIEG